jgi:hypothetical protein
VLGAGPPFLGLRLVSQQSLSEISLLPKESKLEKKKKKFHEAQSKKAQSDPVQALECQ